MVSATSFQMTVEIKPIKFQFKKISKHNQPIRHGDVTSGILGEIQRLLKQQQQQQKTLGLLARIVEENQGIGSG